MILIGIDPGYGRVGYGIIDVRGTLISVLAVGTLETSPKTPHAERLRYIHAELRTLIRTWKPMGASIEKLFFTTNQKTAIPVAEARGVILLTAALEGLRVYEYTPSQVKLAITGSGTADKKAVEKMVFLMLGRSDIHGHDDAIDAIALAITAAYDRNRIT